MRYGFNTSESIATEEGHVGGLLPSLADPDGREAIRIGDAALSYESLAQAAAAAAHQLHGSRRVAVWAQPTLELAIAVVGALAAGAAVVPINPGLGPRELGHIVDDSTPDRFARLAGRRPAGAARPHSRASTSSPQARAEETLPDELPDDDTAFVMYTSGTTGPPKGVQIPRRAITSNLDALRRDLAVDLRGPAHAPRCRCSTSTGS